MLGDLSPAGYTLHQVSRKEGRGGGVAILCRSGLIVTRSTLVVAETFESLSICVSSGACSTRIVVLYRPPSTSTTNFLVELASLLDTLVLYPTSLLLAGDFNFHMDSSTSINSVVLRDLLTSYDLEQHVQTPTHMAGHILDLVITRSSEDIISDVTVYNPQWSDCCSVKAQLHVVKPPPVRKEVTTCNYKMLNGATFREDLEICVKQLGQSSDLDMAVADYKKQLSIMLDRHAPKIAKTITVQPNTEWYDATIHQAKQRHCQLEHRWQKSKLEIESYTVNRDSRSPE